MIPIAKYLKMKLETTEQVKEILLTIPLVLDYYGKSTIA